MKWNSNGGTVKVERLTDRVMVEQLRWNTIFTGKVTYIAFTSNFCNNYSHAASLYFTFLRPCPTRPRVPYLMSSSPSSRVLNSQVPTQSCIPMPPSPCPLPLLYTAPQKEKNDARKAKEEGRRESGKKKSRLQYVVWEVLLTQKLSWNFAFCTCPNITSYYFASGSEGHEVCKSKWLCGKF